MSCACDSRRAERMPTGQYLDLICERRQLIERKPSDAKPTRTHGDVTRIDAVSQSSISQGTQKAANHRLVIASWNVFKSCHALLLLPGV